MGIDGGGGGGGAWMRIGWERVQPAQNLEERKTEKRTITKLILQNITQKHCEIMDSSEKRESKELYKFAEGKPITSIRDY